MARFAELIQFWQDPKCSRCRTFWRKKLCVSLEKDFIFCFHIYFSASFAFYFLISYTLSAIIDFVHKFDVAIITFKNLLRMAVLYKCLNKTDMEMVGSRFWAMYQCILNVFLWNDWSKVTNSQVHGSPLLKALLFQNFQWISAAIFEQLIQFSQDRKCSRCRTFWRNELSVLLEKDFIFRFHIYVSASFTFYFLVSHTYTHTHTHTDFIYIYIYRCIYTYTYIYTHTHTQTHTYLTISLRICVCESMCVYLRLSGYISFSFNLIMRWHKKTRKRGF